MNLPMAPAMLAKPTAAMRMLDVIMLGDVVEFRGTRCMFKVLL